MTLTYKHVLSNYALYGYVDIIQEIVNKGTYVNAKGENKEMLLYLACANNHDGVILILCMILNLLFTFFLFHKS